MLATTPMSSSAASTTRTQRGTRTSPAPDDDGRPAHREVAADTHHDEDRSLDGELLDLVEEVLHGHADEDPERDVDADPDEGRRDHREDEGAPRSADRARDQRGVDAEPRDQPADRDPSPSGGAKPLLDALEVALLAQTPGKAPEAAVADGPRPAVADQRAGDTGDQRQRDERVRDSARRRR